LTARLPASVRSTAASGLARGELPGALGRHAAFEVRRFFGEPDTLSIDVL
jgi:hypothetical protein